LSKDVGVRVPFLAPPRCADAATIDVRRRWASLSASVERYAMPREKLGEILIKAGLLDETGLQRALN
jgi:hypothetical protein